MSPKEGEIGLVPFRMHHRLQTLQEELQFLAVELLHDASRRIIVPSEIPVLQFP